MSSESFYHGGVKFPLPLSGGPTGTGNTLLRDADPTVFYLLDFFTWCVRNYLGARCLEAAADAGLTGITDSVMGTSPYDPVPLLLETQMQFPMLAVWRIESEFVDRTLLKRQDTSTLVMAYVLPPMVGSQVEQMFPILHAAKGMFDRKCVERADPGYAPPGAALGDSIADLASLADLECVKADFGAWPGASGLFFPSIVATLSAIETAAQDLSSFELFTGATAHMDVDRSQDTSSANVDFPLTIVSLSPTSGPRAGGQSVVIATANAKPGTVVLFQGAKAVVTDIAANGTSITVRTPALAAQFAGYPTSFPADVTVVGLDGQSARLAAAYTYAAP